MRLPIRPLARGLPGPLNDAVNTVTNVATQAATTAAEVATETVALVATETIAPGATNAANTLINAGKQVADQGGVSGNHRTFGDKD